MDMFLIRTSFEADGIFGRLLQSNGSQLAVTCEHSYPCGEGFEELNGWSVKLPAGQYTCVRGMHRLAHMAEPFETFEIMGVPGHTNILFHVGNYNSDSEGCVLIGQSVVKMDGVSMITNSRIIFAKLMALQTDVSSFILNVSNNT